MTTDQLCEKFIEEYRDDLPYLFEHYPNQLMHLIKLFKYYQKTEEQT